MRARLILLGVFTFLVIAIIAGVNLLRNNMSPLHGSEKEQVLMTELEDYISNGYTTSPGALPVSYQLEELRKKIESGDYLFASGNAFGETSIAAQNHAFEKAKQKLSKDQSDRLYNFQTVFRCSLEKNDGVDVFLVLAIKKE